MFFNEIQQNAIIESIFKLILMLQLFFIHTLTVINNIYTIIIFPVIFTYYLLNAVDSIKRFLNTQFNF